MFLLKIQICKSSGLGGCRAARTHPASGSRPPFPARRAGSAASSPGAGSTIFHPPGMTDPSRGTTFKRRRIAGTFLQPSPEHPTPPFCPHPAPLGAVLRSHRGGIADIHHRFGMLRQLFLRALSGTRRLLCCCSSQLTTLQLLVRLPVNRTSCFAAACAAGAKPIITWWSCHSPSSLARQTREICFNCSSSNTGLSLTPSARDVKFSIP